MMAERFELLEPILWFRAGAVLVRCHKPDYGLKSDHEKMTGCKHINLSEDGEYPFITVPITAVRLLPTQTKDR